MSNAIKAHLEFCFKGQTYRPSLTLDLDEIMSTYGTIPPLHTLLAQQINIDSYSYEYEMLLAEDILFSEATGLASHFINDYQFDQVGFEQQWRQQQQLDELRPLIQQLLNIDDITQHPNLEKVLLAAYQLGQKSTKESANESNRF